MFADHASISTFPTLESLSSQILENLIRKNSDSLRDPSCPECSALSSNQLQRALPLRNHVSTIPPFLVSDILHRILNYKGESSGPRKVSPMDIYIMMHPSLQKFTYPRLEDHGKRFPIRNTQKAILETIHRCKFLEVLDISGMSDQATPLEYNDFQNSTDCKDHYLYVLEDSIYHLENLVVLKIGNLATNSICKAISETCHNLKEFRFCGPCKVTDLGLRYLAGRISSVDSRHQRLGFETTFHERSKRGCLKLSVLSLMDVEKISLHTITLLLIHLPELIILEHNHLLEALWLMHKTGMTSQAMISFKLLGYEGRGAAQCNPEYFLALQELCPKIASLRLGMTFPETFINLVWFKNITELSVLRVSSVENLDLALTSFGHNLKKLELKNCTDFQSGTALHIRKYCTKLQSLILEIDSSEGNGGGIEGALGDSNGNNNVIVLQNQVQDLQSRLNHLQIVMLKCMNQYGPFLYLEELVLKSLSMGSLLIVLPFAPNLKHCTLKYSTRSGEIAPNLSDSLFVKIFEKNKFSRLEHLTIWCKSVGAPTARWFTQNCPHLRVLKNLSFWNMDIDEQVLLWKEGRHREPIPVDVDF